MKILNIYILIFDIPNDTYNLTQQNCFFYIYFIILTREHISQKES